MATLNDLTELGQSIWFDYIERSLITSGKLRSLIDGGIRGLTSNPTIFEKAITGSADYDDEMKRLIAEGKSVDEIYEALVIRDIAGAADLFRPLYDGTEGADGFVSLEVSPELAHDTEKTIAQAKRLFETLGRPNLMIKVPATEAGLPAIRELIGSGVNVNVTLIFSIESYKAVAEAYIAGLEKLSTQGPTVAGGLAVDRIASVASFFVSRVDSAVDKALEGVGETALQGKIAVANSKVAYAESATIFSGPRWEGLAGRGARIQRLLWASTGTKNPAYPDTLYVDELIGPDTVNTLPPATIDHVLDHGKAEETLTVGVDEAAGQVKRLAEVGVDLDAITAKLQTDGVASFAASFRSLIAGIAEKREALAVEACLQKMAETEMVSRIWKHDHTVWKEDPAEITNRLGWLDSPTGMVDAVAEIGAFVDEVRAAGYKKALLLGMGGSSLAPEVFRLTFGISDGYLDIQVLDSTDAGSVLAAEQGLDLAETLFIASSKSGGTVETASFMKYFYNRTVDALGAGEAGAHFAAITDPGSGLEATAKSLGFRRVFLNDPNIGGRYSALSYFGLVPAGLVGVDLSRLLGRAATMAQKCGGGGAVTEDDPGARLGAILGTAAKAGRDKVTLVASPSVEPFGPWAEQLIAESTGKEGIGILPVVGEDVASPEAYGKDRLFVHLRLNGEGKHDQPIQVLEDAGHPVVRFELGDLYDLGGEFFRWEMATAVAGAILEINPFDQPNVESAKILAREMVAAFEKEGKLPDETPTARDGGIEIYAPYAAGTLDDALKLFFARVESGEGEAAGRSYVAIQAYLQARPELDDLLQAIRTGIQKRHRLATTVGYGPRFLHSTGQLHKGDAGHGLFIQITADPLEDAPIPDAPGEPASTLSFGVLKLAQARGDRKALLDGGRTVLRLHLGKDVGPGLERLRATLAELGNAG